MCFCFTKYFIEFIWSNFYTLFPPRKTKFKSYLFNKYIRHKLQLKKIRVLHFVPPSINGKGRRRPKKSHRRNQIDQGRLLTGLVDDTDKRASVQRPNWWQQEFPEKFGRVSALSLSSISLMAHRNVSSIIILSLEINLKYIDMRTYYLFGIVFINECLSDQHVSSL